MHFAVVGVGVAEVFLHVLGQQVAPVAGRVDQHVRRGRCHRPVEHRLERLVARFTLLEAQVVAEHDELLVAASDHVHDVRQVGEVGFVHLDQAQAARRIFVQAGLDQRRLAGAACSSEQHVVGRLALHELQRVALDLFLLRLDFLEVIQADIRHVPYRLERPVPGRALAIAPGDRLAPVRRRQRLRKDGFDAGEQLRRPLEQLLEFVVHSLSSKVRTGSLR